MRTAWAANEPNQLLCTDCAVRPLSVCAALDQAELRELYHLGRRVHFLPRETAFAQEELTTVNRLPNLALTQFWRSSYSAPTNLA
jgi:CRP/FNR family transcriptional regulator, anaerobic regulatory protein